MATITLDDAITQAIATHAEWTARLRTIIANGTTDLDARQVRREERCDFGKWIAAQEAPLKRRPRFLELRKLHARFHEATARVILLIDERRRAEALASLQPDGEFTLAAADLAKALAKWAAAT